MDFSKKFFVGFSLFMMASTVSNIAHAAGESDAAEKSLAAQASKVIADKESTKAAGKAGQADPKTAALCAGVDANAEAAAAAYLSCDSSRKLAYYGCGDSVSPHIMEATTIATGLVSVGQTLTQSCSMYKSGVDKINMILQAYTVACGAARYKCNSDCTDAVAKIKTALAANEKCTYASAANAKFMESSQAATTQSSNVCKGYSWQLANAGAMIFQLMQGSSLAEKCKDQTAVASKVDCSLPANNLVEECICERSPRRPGCPGAAGLVDANGNGLTNTNLGTPPTPAGPGSGNVSFDPSAKAGGAFPGSSSGSSGAGAGGGAGSAAGGGSGTSNKGADGKATARSGLNANILGGDSGGGGGGRLGSGSGADNSAYGAYMPGGSKDPKRGTASANKIEVTGAGGEDNFQKITNRYRDNKSTLMGQ